MKFKALKNELLPLLQLSNGFTSPKNVNTILQNILIEATDDSIILRASNLQTGFCGKLNTTVEVTGSTTVSGKKFLDIIKELPDSAIIDFQFDGSKLKIKSGKSSFSLSTLNPEQFVTMSQITPEYHIQLDSSKFLDVLKKTYFCISSDLSKIEYTGAHLKVFGNTIEISSADFQRIATAKFNFDESYADEFIINIPKKTVSEIMKILDSTDTVEIETDKRQVQFKIGDIIIYSKLIEKYIRSLTKLFESEYPISVNLPTSEFYEVIKRVSAISSEITHGVVLSFSDDKVSIYSVETEYGQGFETIDGINLDGSPIDIIFNSKHLLDIIANVNTDQFTLKMAGRRNPAVILPDDDSYAYLAVPISIDRY